MEPQTPVDDRLADMVEETLELTRKNNKILKAMRRDALIMGTLKTLIWIVLLAASLYFTMQFLEPYMGMLQGAGSPEQMEQYRALFEQYKGFLGQ